MTSNCFPEAEQLFQIKDDTFRQTSFCRRRSKKQLLYFYDVDETFKSTEASGIPVDRKKGK
jgi:hypothetical protein